MTRARVPGLLVGFVLGLALGPAPAVAGQSRPARIQLGKTSLGMLLVNRSGFTIYAFSKDRRNHDACQKIKLCLQAWPPVTSAQMPVAGKGVKAALLGTIKLKNGQRQVTYAGHPLYTYVGDNRPRETNFVNILQFGGRWPALDAAGKKVT